MINPDGAKITFVMMVHIFQIGQFKISQRTNFWPPFKEKMQYRTGIDGG
jgi:hypothetical protein